MLHLMIKLLTKLNDMTNMKTNIYIYIYKIKIKILNVRNQNKNNPKLKIGKCTLV